MLCKREVVVFNFAQQQCWCLSHRKERDSRHLSLLAFDGFVNLLDKHQGCAEADIPQHQKHGVADNTHIAKVETGLQKAVHI